MEQVENLIISRPVQLVLEGIAKVMKWGTIIIETKDGKVVMIRIHKDLKISTY